MKITFRGREVEVEQLAEGVAKKNDKIFYVKDSITGEWLYANAARFIKLTEKFGSMEDLGQKYIGRAGKKQAPKPVAEVTPAETV